MTGPDRALQLSGSITLDAGKLAERVAELVLAGLAERGVGIQPPAGQAGDDGRKTEDFTPAEMPPRGTVRFGDRDGGAA